MPQVAARLDYCQSDIPRVIMVTSTRSKPMQRNQIRRPARALGTCCNIIMVFEAVLDIVGHRNGNIYFSRDVKRRATPIYATSRSANVVTLTRTTRPGRWPDMPQRFMQLKVGGSPVASAREIRKTRP